VIATVTTAKHDVRKHSSLCRDVIDPVTNLRYVEVDDTPTTPFINNKVVSLFSGAGGLDLGLEQAGFETRVCVEYDADCRATLAYNRPNWRLALGGDLFDGTPGDIRKLSGLDILRAGKLRRGEAALVVGGPPCQPFSNIGKREGVADENNGDLFQHYVRVVKEVTPQAFIFENVSGFTQAKHQDALDWILSELGPKYDTVFAVLNSADYGVPQQRKRFIMLGFRRGYRTALPFPTHFQSQLAQQNLRFRMGLCDIQPFRPWVTVAQALETVDTAMYARSDYAVMNVADFVRDRMTLIKQGENFKVLPMEMRPKCWQEGRHQGQDTFGRLRADRPSVTIRTAAYNPAKGMYIHPYENRGLNSHEMAALQSFPPEWMFRCVGREKVTLVSVGKQIGNAVPPLLGKAIGLAMRRALTD
jgi:DNA (cytosine-5)-methyltransferase 1